MCEKSLLRGVSVKFLCIVSGSLHFFFFFFFFWSLNFLSYCTLWKMEQQEKGKGTCFFLFSRCSISITCLQHFSQQERGGPSPASPYSQNSLLGAPERTQQQPSSGPSPVHSFLWVPTPPTSPGSTLTALPILEAALGIGAQR